MAGLVPTARGNYEPYADEKDTGWRVIPTASGVAMGQLLARRIGDIVYIGSNDLVLTAGAGGTTVAVWPDGLKPKFSKSMIGINSSSVNSQERLSNRSSDGRLWWTGSGTGSTTTTRPTAEIEFDETYATADPWPAVLPGTAA